MTPMTTLQRDRRHAAIRGEQWLRSRLGDAWVDAHNADRVEYYRGLLAEANRRREAKAILVAPEPMDDSETLF